MTFFSPHLTITQLEQARDVARAAHAGQTRWEGTDYFENHSVLVADRLIVWQCPTYDAALGLMHDVVEDTDRTLDDLRTELSTFPPQFFADLDALTLHHREPYVRYIRRLIRTGSPSAWRVKSADAQSNWIDLLRENYPEKHRQRGDKYGLAIIMMQAQHVLVTGDLIPIDQALRDFV